jgi:hypothetical protein
MGIVMDREYSLDQGRRVMIGLSEAETVEFEILDAQIPYDGKPVWPDTANSPTEDRWLELFTKHQFAKEASMLRVGGKSNPQDRRPQPPKVRPEDSVEPQ